MEKEKDCDSRCYECRKKPGCAYWKKDERLMKTIREEKLRERNKSMSERNLQKGPPIKHRDVHRTPLLFLAIFSRGQGFKNRPRGGFLVEWGNCSE